MTALLLDTHVLLWAAARPDRLGAIRPVLTDSSTTVLVSAVTTWELAIKRSLGRLTLPHDAGTFVRSQRRRLRLTALAIREDHAARVEHLPDHHADPFDRLLVAQAQVEEAVLATADEDVARYDIEVLAP